MEDINLTSDQQEFLKECEEEFKDRYTEKDSNFMKIKMQVSKKPPIVDPWYNKPRRSYDWVHQDRNQNHDRYNHHWNRSERTKRWERPKPYHHKPYQRRMY